MLFSIFISHDDNSFPQIKNPLVFNERVFFASA